MPVRFIIVLPGYRPRSTPGSLAYRLFAVPFRIGALKSRERVGDTVLLALPQAMKTRIDKVGSNLISGSITAHRYSNDGRCWHFHLPHCLDETWWKVNPVGVVFGA